MRRAGGPMHLPAGLPVAWSPHGHSAEGKHGPCAVQVQAKLQAATLDVPLHGVCRCRSAVRPAKRRAHLIRLSSLRACASQQVLLITPGSQRAAAEPIGAGGTHLRAGVASAAHPPLPETEGEAAGCTGSSSAGHRGCYQSAATAAAAAGASRWRPCRRARPSRRTRPGWPCRWAWPGWDCASISNAPASMAEPACICSHSHDRRPAACTVRPFLPACAAERCGRGCGLPVCGGGPAMEPLGQQRHVSLLQDANRKPPLAGWAGWGCHPPGPAPRRPKPTPNTHSRAAPPDCHTCAAAGSSFPLW